MLKKHALKFFLIMRLTIFILTATMIQVSAAALAQTVTYTNKNISLIQLFKVIKSQTGYNVVWYEGSLDVSKTVDVNFKKATIEEVMNYALKDQALSFSVEKQTIVVKDKDSAKTSKPKSAAQITITGSVFDDQGQPLAGVSIKVKGENAIVMSDNKGNFKIIVPENGVSLLLSFIGYETKEIAAANDLKIFLKRSTSKLDEVQIMAYGTTTERTNTGDITSVKAADIAEQSVSNVLEALEGRVPGLTVTESSGVVGAGVKVQLRGQGSLLQGTDPLFIIDGVPFAAGNTPLNSVVSAAGSGGSSGISPLYTINPADIESIDVLKDADATSIYGSRGANGVILITTKRGSIGKTKVSANFYSGLSDVTRTMDMLNTQQYIEMRNEGFKNDGVAPTTTNAPDLLLWDNNRYTDFKSLLIGGTAHTTDGELSVSGGNVNTQFLIGGGYHSETTVFPGSLASDRASAHLSLDHRSTDKKFKLGLSVSYANNQSNLTGVDLTAYINTPPNLQLYDSNGKPNWQEGGVYYTGLITNPIAMTYTKYSGSYQNLNSNLTLSYELVSGLQVKSSMGYNTVTTEEESLNPSTSINPSSGTLPYSNFGNTAQNSWIIEPQIEYTKTLLIGKLNILLGSTFQDNTYDNILVQAQNYNSDLLLSSIAAAGSSTSTNSNSDYRYTAFYGRLNYNWQDKYLLNLTGRRDGSSRFGPNNQFANFGALGAAWIFSNEAVVKDNLPFISFGKLRASYGTTGNDQIGNYKYLNTWTSTNLGYQGVPGLQPSNLYNPDFAWESNRKAEVALDLGAFSDRVLFTVAYFNDRSGDQLINYKLPIQTGFASVLRNLDAIIENSGFEISATTKNVTTKAFSWITSFNVTLPKNELVAFPGLETSSYANTYILGQPLSAKKVFQYLGVDPQSGVYQFTDVNKDGVLDVNDKNLIENTQPKFYGGMQNSLKYKGLQLDVFLEFKKQIGFNYLYTQSLYLPGYFYINQPTIVLQRWQNPGDVANIQKFTATGVNPAFTAGYSSLGNSNAVYSDASYIRLKTLALSYSISPLLSKKLHVEGLKIYLQGQNLLTITNYIGADPENQNLFVLPPLRTITAGIQLTL